MATDYGALANKLDELIGQYKTAQATEMIEGLVQKDVPSLQRARFASFARRLGKPKTAIKILHPNVVNLKTAAADDVLEYATNLRRLGLIHPCRRLLESMKNHPNRDLHLAYCSIHQWEYYRAIEELNSFMNQPNVDAKLCLVAETNRIAGQIITKDFERAQHHLEILVPKVEKSYPHLYLNSLELSAQLSLEKGDLETTQDYIDRALVLAGSEPGFTKNQIEKWSWILAVLQGTTEFDSPSIQDFRTRVRQSADWESLRDFDFRMARIAADEHLLQTCYFSTPFQGFKNLFHEDMPNCMTRIDPRTKGTPVFIDPLTGQGLDLPFGLAEHRLLILLLSDKYQPWSIYRIFDFLNGDEHFDPEQSHRKIYQLMRRLEKNLEGFHELELQSSRLGYRLRPRGNGHCHVYQNMVFKTAGELLLFILQLVFEGRSFTQNEVQSLIPSLSGSKVYRELQELAEAGRLKNESSSRKNSFSLI